MAQFSFLLDRHRKRLPDIVPNLALGFTHVDTLKRYDALTTVWPLPSCWHALVAYFSVIVSKLKPDPTCQWPALAEHPALARPGRLRL